MCLTTKKDELSVGGVRKEVHFKYTLLLPLAHLNLVVRYDLYLWVVERERRWYFFGGWNRESEEERQSWSRN